MPLLQNFSVSKIPLRVNETFAKDHSQSSVSDSHQETAVLKSVCHSTCGLMQENRLKILHRCTVIYAGKQIEDTA